MLKLARKHNRAGLLMDDNDARLPTAGIELDEIDWCYIFDLFLQNDGERKGSQDRRLLAVKKHFGTPPSGRGERFLVGI